MDYLQSFDRINLGDKRINKRFMNTLNLLAADPSASVHKACKTETAAKGAYRMFANDRLTETGVVEVGREITMEAIRAGRYPIVLIPQDTTELNYMGLVKTTGLGEIGTNPKLRGLLAHSAIAVTPEGGVLGLLHQKIWARPPEERGQKEKRDNRPIEEKESYRWLETMEQAGSGDFGETKAVYRKESLRDSADLGPLRAASGNLSDREGDIYDYFERASAQGRMVVCRRIHNRKVVGDNGAETIREFLNNQEAAGRYDVTVPKDYHTGWNARVAEMEVRFGTVRVAARSAKRARICRIPKGFCRYAPAKEKQGCRANARTATGQRAGNQRARGCGTPELAVDH